MSGEAAAWASQPLLEDTVTLLSLACSRTCLTEDGNGDTSSEWPKVPVVEMLCLPLFQEGWSFASWMLLAPGWEGSSEGGNGFASKLQQWWQWVILACLEEDWSQGRVKLLPTEGGRSGQVAVNELCKSLRWVLQKRSACVWFPASVSMLQCLWYLFLGTLPVLQASEAGTGTVQGLNDVCSPLINAICETLLLKKVQQCMHGSITMGA